MPAMEPLEAEAAVVDDFLLNFSEDLFLDHDSSSLTLHQPHKTQAGPTQTQQMAEQQQPPTGKNRLLPPHLDPFLTSFPAVEGELDWLNTRCEFPKFDFIPVSTAPSSASRPPKKQAADGWSAGGDPKRPSPVSVLEAAGGTWPVRKRSKAPRRLRAVLPVFRVDQQARPAAAAASADDTTPRRRCWHCRADETPQWRAGPAGPKTLCNACGVRYKSGRLVPEYRPANSPTFSSDLHSNSHRKIIEMRRRKSLVGGAVMHPSSPLPAQAKARKKKRRRKKKQEDANSQEAVEVLSRV